MSWAIKYWARSVKAWLVVMMVGLSLLLPVPAESDVDARTGMGAMMEWKDIVQVVVDKYQLEMEESDEVVEQKNAIVDALL